MVGACESVESKKKSNILLKKNFTWCNITFELGTRMRGFFIGSGFKDVQRMRLERKCFIKRWIMKKNFIADSVLFHLVS